MSVGMQCAVHYLADVVDDLLDVGRREYVKVLRGQLRRPGVEDLHHLGAGISLHSSSHTTRTAEMFHTLPAAHSFHQLLGRQAKPASLAAIFRAEHLISMHTSHIHGVKAYWACLISDVVCYILSELAQKRVQDLWLAERKALDVGVVPAGAPLHDV